MQTLNSDCQVLQILPQRSDADQSGIEPGTSSVVGEGGVRDNRKLAASLDIAKSANSRPQCQGVTIWLGLRTRVRFRVPPPKFKPQPLSVGVFYCLFAPTPACSRGFLRSLADFAFATARQVRRPVLSLLALSLCGRDFVFLPEVRKGHDPPPIKINGLRVVESTGSFAESVGEGKSKPFP